ncbi:Peptidoglycan-binding lysin domain protein, partial [mine drainage metagenome]
EYTVQAGDTLQSIAQTVYGNANLWYVIADANAISVDSSGNAINLIAGTTLKLPAVSNEQNSSQTFTPYNPLKLIGSTTPALAYIPPPPSGHCNTLADLIVVAITAAVTYETMGATSGLLESELGATGSLMTSAAIGGTAGSAAGQLTGDALGVSSGYSLGRALTQGLANGLTAGLTTGLQASGLSALEQGGQLTALGNLADGAGSYAAGVAAAAIVGEPTQFSWAGMAAAALA